MQFDKFQQLYSAPEVSNFLLSERIDRDKLIVKKIYFDVAQDLVAGIVLNQIIFWHCPNDEGEIKLTVERDGYLWLRKKREDWWKECRVTPAQFDKACKHLESLDLIVTELFKWKGAPVKHIRMDWEVFLRALERAKASYGEQLGYKRRSPTKTSGRNRQKTSNNAISIDSENQQNFANSENGISLLAKNPDFHKQRKTRNFANSENDPYINETLNETTNETAPPEPGAPPTQNVCALNRFSDADKSTTKEEFIETPFSSLTNQPTLIAESNPTPEIGSSAAPRDNSGRYRRNQHQYPKNIDGSDRLPWETFQSPREFDSGFEKRMIRSLASYPAFKGLPDGEVLTRVRKHIAGGKYDLKRRDELVIEWDAYQASLQPTPTATIAIALADTEALAANKKAQDEATRQRIQQMKAKYPLKIK